MVPLMPLETQFLIALQALFTAALCVLIGWERERQHLGVGLRTHMLVGVGACLFSALSISAFGGDPARIAAQVVSGVGFIGAGAILKPGRMVQGLTTAASMWMAAAIGMAVAAGGWFIALCATILVWFILAIVKRLKPEMPIVTEPE